MGIESVFDGTNDEPEAEAPEIVEQPPEAPEPEAETPPEPVEAPAVEAPAPEEPRSVPLPTFLDMRDKLKAAERERDEFKAKATAPQAELPDPYDDPKGFQAAVLQEVEQRRVQDRLDFSYQLAADKHGEEKVETARLWAVEQATSDPAFALKLEAQKHPMEWIVQQHAKSQDLSAYETDPIAFAKSILEKHGALGTVAAPAPAVAVEQQQAPQPPKSLASSPSKGGLVREPTESAMVSVFGR